MHNLIAIIVTFRQLLSEVYVADNITLNFDRNKNKPNLFISSNDLALFDHEMTLATIPSATKALLGNQAWTYNFKQHLFFPFLQGLTEKEKASCFDTFFLYLSNLELSKIEELIKPLTTAGFITERMPDYLQYLNRAQQKSTYFVQLLKASIQ